MSKSQKDLQAENDALRAQMAELRAMIEAQTDAKNAMTDRVVSRAGSANPWAELMVGIRNVSDYTVGIEPLLPGGRPYQLAPDFGDGEPGTTAAIPYAEWRELRKTRHVRAGFVIRDDSVVGYGLNVAPADRPDDIPAEAAANTILDPKEWIESRDEDQIRDGIEKITAVAALFRLRRVVDDALGALEDGSNMPTETREQQARRASWALSRLPSKLKLVDDLTSAKIEKRDRPEPANSEVQGRKIRIRM